jgi:tetratricopeptide (TPR) repeat protein
MARQQEIEPFQIKARKIDHLLAELQETLDAAKNPNRIALKSLGVTRLGWTPSVYSNEAFSIWSKQYQRDTEDIEAVHHLAIMHHAKAIDLEQSDNPAVANEHWENSIQLWYALWQSNAFWSRIAECVSKDSKRNAIDELRKDFPILFLKTHYEIVTDTETPQSRINYHVHTALQSPFPEEAKERVRCDAYEWFTSQIPSTIWETHSPEPSDALNALRIIGQFLVKDPKCVPALTDGLSILVRLLRSFYTDINALSSEDEVSRNNILLEMNKTGKEWQPYLDILGNHRDTLEEDVRSNLALWCRAMGEVACALNQPAEGMKYYKFGVYTGPEDDREAILCRRKLGEIEAIEARSMAVNKDNGARSTCDRLSQHTDLPVSAYIYLAHAYKELGDLNKAKEVCRAGIDLEPDYDSYEFIEDDDRAREILVSIYNGILGEQSYLKAKDLYDKHDFQEALPHLNAAIEYEPIHPLYYFIRANCFIEIAEPENAMNDIEFCKTYGGDETAKLEVVKNLEKQIDQQLLLLESYGKLALLTSRQADRYLNDGEFEKADELMRSAIEQSQPEGKKDLKAKLSKILACWGIDEANRVQNEENGTLEDRHHMFLKSRDKLREACTFDPGNDHAKTNLKVLEEVAVNFMANGFRNMSINAYNKNDFDEAINFQRDAIRHASVELKKDLEKELAIFLHAKAVKLANDAQKLYPFTGFR